MKTVRILITVAIALFASIAAAQTVPPVLAPIGPQSVNEGAPLVVPISTTDGDATIAVLSTSILPANASFTDNLDGTGSLTFNPDFTQSGTVNVTFYATDAVTPTDVDSEQVVITVNNVNQAPILTAIGNQSTTENVLLSFGVTASDPDATTPTLTTSTLPSGANFTDNGNGTGSFSWTPGFTQAGSFPVTFYATDVSAAVDSEAITITVNEAGNQTPVLAAIGNRSTTENVLLSFAISATDVDGTTPSFTTSTLPSGANFTDNGNGTGSFTWTPGFTQAGSFPVTFRAIDAGLAVDSESIVITVNEAGNQTPVLAAIGNRSTTENVLLSFAISATDVDGTTPSFTTSTLPSGANFTDNGNGTGSFTWTPGFTQAGSFPVTFRAIDAGLAVDSESITITVNEAGNQAPVLAAIGNRSTTENVLLSFSIAATDVDGTTPSFTTSTLPLGANFTDNGNGTGSFSWTPGFTQAGSFPVTFRAIDAGLAVDSESITITVNEAGNQTPVLAAIGNRSTTENVLLSFSISATDVDGTTPSFTTSTLPLGANFTDNGNGTGSFSWTPGFTQAGSFPVTFRAIDAGLAVDSESIVITVNEAGNQTPVLAAIGNRTTTENVLLSFSISATDVDGTTPTFTTSTLPLGANFTNNGNGTGSFSWTPGFTQAGSFPVTFRAIDAGLAVDSESIVITVNEAGNQTPVLATIGPRSTVEGVLMSFTVTSTDADGVPATLTTTTLPSGASFTDNGNGTGSFTWTPGFTQAGSYPVIFYARDAALAADSEVVSLVVTESGNQAPILATVGARSTTENVILSFSVSASDPDLTTPTLSTSALPSGASFTNNGNGTGSFSWTPNFTQSGTYPVTFYATDAGLAVDSEAIIITVTDAGNQAPVLAAIGPRSTTENVLLSFAISASDIDGPVPSLTTSTLPSGASFVDNGNGTGSFTWTPGFTQAGTYPVTFRATDAGLAVDSESVVITVTEAGNQTPVLAAIGPRATTENILLSFAISASDIDGPSPSLTTSTLPSGANFTDNGNGTGSFTWTPGFTQSGSYPIIFRATDGGLAVDSESVVITVAEAGNQTPVLATIGPRAGTEGVLLTFTVTSTDADGVPATMTSSVLPLGANYTDNGNGTGTFSWTPSFTQAGSYPVMFYARDAALAADSEFVTISIVESGNQAPVLTAIGPRSTTENVLLSFGVSATDPDLTTPTLSTSTLPSGASFVNNGNGTGTFTWTPGFTQAGNYPVTFYATDAGALVDSEAVIITVNEAGNQTPVLAAIGNRSTTENVLLSFSISATDVDGTTPSFTTSTLPLGANFTDNGNGTGTFTWTPGFTQAGNYPVTFRAIDAGLAVDSESITISVAEFGNQPPVLAAIGPRSTTENVLLTFAVSATDVDATIPALTTSTLPSGASFTDNGNGTGTFSWTPGFTQAGSYPVTFRATDAGAAVDSEAIVITVSEAGNQIPVLATVGPRSTTENILLSFTVSSTDADGTFPAMTTSALPLGASYINNGNGTGSFSWTPGFTQAGSYPVTFYATDASLAVDSEAVTITVTEAGNQTPVLATIGPRSTTENVLLAFSVSATDVDGTIPSLTTSALPAGASFTDNGNGTGSFSWTPNFTQAGSYPVRFYATDASLAVDSESVTILVAESGNQAPVLAAIGPRATTENVLLTFSISATDADATTPSLSTSTLPLGASFTDNGNGTGSFSWTPGFTQAGSFPVTFYATDAGLAVDSEAITITVTDAGNQIPVLAAIGARSTVENVLLSFAVSATDPDATTPSLTTSVLPVGASFTDNGNGTGSFNWTPGFTQAGSYPVTFYATDAGLAVDSEAIVITVTEAGNQAPILAAVGPKSGGENALLTFLVFASDPDATTPLMTSSLLPLGATYTDNGNGSGTFSWTPGFTQSGTYPVTFYATDASLAVDSEAIIITINEVGANPPILATIGARAVNEGAVLAFGVTATDADGPIPVLSATGLPTNASFVDNLNGTGSFTFSPDFTQTGIYLVTFFADDAVTPDVDSEVVIINVANINQPPVLAAIGSRSVTEGNLLTVNVGAADADGFIPLLTTSALPVGALFTDNGNGTGVLSWTPGFLTSGPYFVTFRAADDSAAVDSEVVSITVIDAGNQAPVLAAISNQSATENILVTFGVSATDAESTPTLTTSALPAGASFVDLGNGTGTFSWTPGFTQSGIHPVTFYATDAGLAVDSQAMTITVADAGNQLPILATIGLRTITEGALLAFVVSATDAEGIPLLTTSALPLGATFVDNGNGTGSFSWTPGFTQSGNYPVSFYATDAALAVDSELVTIIVSDPGNQPPLFTTVNDTSIAENGLLVINVSATDADAGGIFPTMSITTSIANFSFVDNLNGTGTFTYNPSYFDGGLDTVRFIATDFGTPRLSSTEIVAITTVEVNQPPTIDSIGPFGVKIGDSLVFIATGRDSTDASGLRILMSASGLPAGATFTDNLNSTGTFRFKPVAGQAGDYNVTIFATDQGSPQYTTPRVILVKVLNVNQPPVLAPIGPRQVLEGNTLTINLSATDTDGPFAVQFQASGMPSNSSIIDNGNGTGVFTYTPAFTHAGLQSVTIKAYDGAAIDKEIVLIQVFEAGNQLPIFDSMPAPSGTEGAPIAGRIIASDPDGGTVTISVVAGTAPSGFALADSGNGVATFSYTPLYNASGTYIIGIIVADGSGADTSDLVLTVADAGNQTPILLTIADKQVTETKTLSFAATSVDVDSTISIMSASPLPPGATFTDNLNGTGSFNWTPGSNDSGIYVVTFYAVDALSALLYDSQLVNIIVKDTNRVPIVGTLPHPTQINEGQTVTMNVFSSDPDGQTSILSAYLSGGAPLAANMNFVDNGNGTGVFTFTPSTSQGNGNPFYYPVFRATDSRDPLLFAETGGAANSVRVMDVPVPPTMTFSLGTGPFTLIEGDSLKFNVVAVDPDGTPVTLAATGMPPTATFVGVAGSRSFRFVAPFSSAGNYTVQFTATDGAAQTAIQSVSITVTEAGNQAPVFSTVLPVEVVVYVGAPNITSLKATDPDLNPLTITAVPLLTGAALVDSGNGGAAQFYTPVLADAGLTQQVRFIVSDGALADTVITQYRVLSFMRGDSDGDHKYTINDIVYLVNYLFRSGSAPSPLTAADVNKTGSVNINDITYMVNFLYKNGPQPPA